MKHVFIINSHAGPTDAFEFISKSLEPFKEAYDILIYHTTKSKDATKFIKDYVFTHTNEEVRFYACGGDGTLNEVVNGAYGFENASVSIYPSGSGNDFVKAVGGIDKYLDIKNLLDCENKKIDLILVNDELLSINVCNFGFDAYVAKVANQLKEKHVKNSYEKGVMKGLFCAMKNNVEVVADGDNINPSNKFLLTTLGNGEYVGCKYKCAPLYVLDDGLMEVCLVKRVSVLNFLKLVKYYEKGEHLTHPAIKKYIVYRRAKEVKIHSEKPFDVSLDGEIYTGTDFKFKILHKAINFGIIK